MQRTVGGSSRAVSITLTMIVRDAADFVTDTLASVLPFIDTWTIVDTGSVDDTPRVITDFFAAAGVPGTLHHRPWVGFAHNRSEALELSAGTADFALMMDADDLIAGELPIDTIDPDVDLYLLRFGPDFVYWRAGLFNLAREWEYRGVVHEYAVPRHGDARTERLEGPYDLVFRSLGGRGKDPEKYKRDVEALLAAWETNPDDPRTAYYLGQSYRDGGELEQAIEWFERRLAMSGWNEEAFVTAVEIGRCLRRVDAPDDDVIAAFERAAAIRPTRAEAWYELALLYRTRERWQEGYDSAVRAASIPFPAGDILFVPADIYRWRITDERSICAHYLGLHDEAAALCEELLASPHLPPAERPRIMANREQSLIELIPERVRYNPERVVELMRAPRSASGPGSVTLTITSCRRRHLFERAINSFLATCTDLDRIGRWICIDDGSSPEDRDRIADLYPFFEFIFKPYDEQGHPSSMNELMHAVQSEYWLHLEDDYDFVTRVPLVDQTIKVLDDDPQLVQVVLNRNYVEVFDQRDAVGGEPRRTRADGFPYLVHYFVPMGTPEFDELLQANPGRITNAHWPGFSLMPSMMRTASVKGLGAFNPGSGQFEREFAHRALDAGLRTAFLDNIVCVTTGRLRNDLDPSSTPNSYQLVGIPGNQWFEHITVSVTDAQRMDRWRRHFPSGGSWRGVELTTGDASHADMEVTFDENRTLVMRSTATGAPTVVHERTPRWFVPALDWHVDATWDELRVNQVTKSRDLSVVLPVDASSPRRACAVALVEGLRDRGVVVDVFAADPQAWPLRDVELLKAGDTGPSVMAYRYVVAFDDRPPTATHHICSTVVDALVCDALCFVVGDSSLSPGIEPQSVVSIPADDVHHGVDVIAKALTSDLYDARRSAIRRAKRQILDQQSVAPTLSRIARGIRFVESLDVHVINLDRRPDRLAAFQERLRDAVGDAFVERCQRFSAFDGRDVVATDDIRRMFGSAQPPLRKAEVACAMSHMALWWQTATGDGRPALIFEDDAVVGSDFLSRVVEVAGHITEPRPTPDVVMLGLSRETGQEARADVPQRDAAVDRRGIIGGTIAYLITQRGARRLWEIATRDGMQNALDWFVLRQDGAIELREAVPHLAEAPVHRHGQPTIDSDVQYDDAWL